MTEATAGVSTSHAPRAASTRALAATVDKPDFDRFRAAFRDAAVERRYQQYLADETLRQQRRIWMLMTLVYAGYGILDILTIGQELNNVLVVRWLLLTPIAFALYALTFFDNMKLRAGSLFAFGVFLSAASVIWMISILPAQGSPPYLVGILVVFIFSSCNVQMPFPAAAGSYMLSTVAYALMLTTRSDFTRIDIISGLFFMVSSACVAVVTNYVQEMRLRIIWFQDQLRRADARRIEDLMVEATASDRSKINFLSILSHELRTPLHQIIGFSEVLQAQDRCDNDVAREYLNEITASGRRLLGSIAKMLRYADATAGKISYSIDTYPISEVVEIAVDQCASRAAARNIDISLDKIGKGSIQVDQASASYAIECLLDNAINATPEGGRIEITGGTLGDGRYDLRIIDTGCGMTAEQARRALEPFSQIDDARARASEGLGLGLTVARKIFGDQSAELSLDTSKGRGTTARVVFAANKENADANAA